MSTWCFKDDFWFNVTFIYRSVSVCEVYLLSDFNGWTKSDEYKMISSQDEPTLYQLTVLLSEGYYHYKFLVDGQYIRDEANPHIGGELNNSIMFVHMDPNVYGLRNQYPPERTYHRPNGDGSEFQVLLPSVPYSVSSYGILQRYIYVYLPPSYKTNPDKNYPVVYAHDGQNLFSSQQDLPWGGWYLDAKLDHWWSEGHLPEFILVAIPNSDYVCIGNRQREYTSTDLLCASNDPYLCYIVEVIKPEIDKKYRTLTGPAHTFTLGSSLGGFISFLLPLSLPDVFSCGICLSPAFWFVDSHNRSAFTLIQDSHYKKTRLYIDSGDGEGDNKELVRDMAILLQECDWIPGEDFMYYFDQCKERVPLGVTHSEAVWRERVFLGLQFAFKQIKI